MRLMIMTRIKSSSFFHPYILSEFQILDIQAIKGLLFFASLTLFCIFMQNFFVKIAKNT